MAKDLFEDENGNKIGDKSPEDQSEIIVDDENAEAGQYDEDWIPLTDEELDISIDDEKTDGLRGEEEETRVFSDGENAETAPDDKAWIPREDKKTRTSPTDEGTVESSEDELNYEEIAEWYAEEEEIEADNNNEMEGTPDDHEGRAFDDIETEEAEAPPWSEGVEIPLHGETGSPKHKGVFVIGGVLVFVALVVIGLYAFLKPAQMFLKNREVKLEREKPSLFTQQVEKKPIKEAEPEKGLEKAAEPEDTGINTAPNIKGTPVTSLSQGTPYSFIPEASDMDTDDKLSFFVANQPAWTSFDINTGALTGTPHGNDVGVYENIVIMVSDGTATASLPAFTITVTGIAPELSKATSPEKKTAAEAKITEETGPPQQPIVKKDEIKKAAVGQYMLPDLTGLVKQSQIQDAAKGYYNEVKKFSKAYSLKLEVDCVEESVQVAFRQGDFDRRMFILPRQINGKDCFVVFWGLYATKNEATKALSHIPIFFNEQSSKPQIVIIKQYL